ncbi:MAG: hypothetical protein ACREDO_12960 [Methyloceanibacter sp.]
MKTVLAAVLALLVCTSPALCFFPDVEEIEEGAGQDIVEAPDNSPPAAPGVAGDVTDQKPDAGSAESTDDAGTEGDLMKDVHRDRPGACPEGPSCKSGD